MNKSRAIKELIALDEARFKRIYGFIEKASISKTLLPPTLHQT